MGAIAEAEDVRLTEESAFNKAVMTESETRFCS
jgi:hypothetical protein